LPLLDFHPLIFQNKENELAGGGHNVSLCTKGCCQMHVSFPFLLAALTDWLYYGILGLGVIGLIGLLMYLRKKQGGEED
jgi:hypothetical protein